MKKWQSYVQNESVLLYNTIFVHACMPRTIIHVLKVTTVYGKFPLEKGTKTPEIDSKC